MEVSQRLKLTLTLLVGLGALFLLAAGLSNLELQTGFILMEPLQQVFIEEEEEEAAAQPEFVDPFNLTSVLVIGSIIALTLYAAYRSPQVRAAVIGLLIFTGMVLGMLYLYRLFGGGEPPEEEEVALPPQIEERRISQELLDNPPDWTMAITIVVLLVLAIAIFLAVRYWLRRSRRDSDALDVITAGAEAALDQLQAGADIRDTVLRCYVEMNQGLKMQLGLVRNEGMTPREFEKRLAAAGLPDAAVKRLTRLFEEVRYGRRATTEADREEAVACLQAIISSAKRRVEHHQNLEQAPTGVA